MRLTQEQLAEKADKSLRLITDIERGAVGMSIETLMSLCEGLKVTPNDLLLPASTPAASELGRVLHAIANASDHMRASAILRSYLRSA